MSGTDYTQTANYGLYKPIANADNNAWGNHLNLNADTLDGLLHTVTGGAAGPFLPTAGGAMTGVLNYTATGGTTPRSAQDRAADVANVLDYGADPTGTTDSASAINAALATGKAVWLPKGNYRVNSALNVGPGAHLYGDGRGITNVMVDQAFSSSALGVIVLTGREELSPIVSDLSIVFAQPIDQASRANFKTLAAGGTSGLGGTGVMYPPGIYSDGTTTGSNRFKIERVQVRLAWTAIYAIGIGGAWLKEVEVSALNTGLFIGDSRDWIHVEGYHFWSFGIATANPLFNVYWDGNTVSMDFGSTGGVNGGNMVDCVMQAKVKMTNSLNWMHFANLMIEGNNSSLAVTGSSFVQITNLYIVTPQNAAATSGIEHSGGTLMITNLYMSMYAVPLIHSTGGELYINGGKLLNGTASNPAVLAVTGGVVDIKNVTFGLNVTSGAWTTPIVSFAGSGALRFQNNNFRDASPGDVGGVVLSNDVRGNVVANNSWNGWGWQPPGVSGHYGFNAGLGMSLWETLLLSALPGRSIGMIMDAQAGNQRSINVTTGGLLRWEVIVNAASEGGSNAGSDFSIARYSDAGANLSTPFAITRSTGRIALQDLRGAPTYANDAAAATGGVGLGEVYRNGSAVQVRVA